MGVGLLLVGRIVFVVFLGTQALVLALYSDHYGEGSTTAPLAAIYVGAFLALMASCTKFDEISWLWFVWLLYSVAFTAMVGAIFGRIVIPHKLQNESFFGPNVLKMTLCIAPVELLLLLNTATDVPAYHKALTELSFTATLDLFDGIEMLNVILENGEGPNAIAVGTSTTILVFVCAFFLLSFMGILEIKPLMEGLRGEETVKLRKCVFRIGSVFRSVVNASFLILRIYLWSNNGLSGAIFITKNIISLVLIVIRFLLVSRYV